MLLLEYQSKGLCKSYIQKSTVKLDKTDQNSYFGTLEIDQRHTSNGEVFT